MVDARREPMNPPTRAVVPSSRLYLTGSSTFLLANPPTAKMFCDRIATREVALANVMGMPRKVRMGTVKREPPPPTVLTNAATNPTAVISRYSYQAMTIMLVEGTGLSYFKDSKFNPPVLRAVLLAVVWMLGLFVSVSLCLKVLLGDAFFQEICHSGLRPPV